MMLAIFSSFAWRPADQVLLEAAHPVRQQARAVQQIADHERLVDVELELAVHAADGAGATWLPMTWAQTMVRASHWVGLTLPGMMELPGSFSGRHELAEDSQRGPLPR